MKQLTGQELRALLAAPGTAPPGWLLLDVREPWEVALARVDVDGLETRCLPMNEIPSRLDELDPARPIVCLCHHGVRSAHVVAFLERHGFDDAWNLAGGIDAWSTEVDAGVARY